MAEGTLPGIQTVTSQRRCAANSLGLQPGLEKRVWDPRSNSSPPLGCLHKARLLAQLGVPFQPSKPRPHTTQCLCHHCILRHSCPSGSQQRPHPRRTAAKPSLCVHMHAAQQMVL